MAQQQQAGGLGVKLKLDVIVRAPNVAALLPDAVVARIGSEAVEGYTIDRATRAEWEQRNAEAIRLALQVAEVKSFPWENCSNVKFPIVTIAALQFLSRVSILTKGRQIVKCEVLGQDEHGVLAARAKRIGTHMSYQLVEEDKDWIDDDEKAKLSASLVGCAFKKSYFDPIQGINISEHVPASQLVVDYATKNLSKANRITHLLMMTANDIQERVRSKLFLELDSRTPSGLQVSELREVADEVAGLASQADSSIPIYEVLEQHTWLDLDGDGYQEPYIVFVRRDTAQCLRIVARFFDEGDVSRTNDAAIRSINYKASTLNEEARAQAAAESDKLRHASDNFITRIEPLQYFTKIPFIPSPDGGFYDLGLGSLLGPSNSSVDTLINQLIDAGTMSNTAGGFLGRGVKLKGGKNSFDPFEWKPVDSSGDDLRKNIVPLPVRDPSAVLFQLLGLLISYSEKISGATDIMTGANPGQNTPAETSRNTIEQGMKLFSGIYGRMHRAFKRELEILFKLNQLYLPSSKRFAGLTTGVGALISKDDYLRDDARIFPAADVSMVSDAQRQQQAIMLKQAAAGSSGYNRYLVEVNFLEAFDVQNIAMLYPDPQGPNAIPQGVDPKLEIEQGYLELEKAQQQMDFRRVMLELQQTADLNAAKISQLQAQAEKLLTEADGADIAQQINAINAQTGAAKAHQESMVEALKIMQRVVDQRHNERKLEIEAKSKGVSYGSARSRTPGMETAPGNAGVSAAPEGVPAGNPGLLGQ